MTTKLEVWFAADEHNISYLGQIIPKIDFIVMFVLLSVCLSMRELHNLKFIYLQIEHNIGNSYTKVAEFGTVCKGGPLNLTMCMSALFS